jgi:hypothetical protein
MVSRLPLIGISPSPHRYLAFPSLAATEVYAIWMKPLIQDLQAIYAPLRWPSVVHIVRSVFGSDLSYEEHRIQGVRIVVIAKEKLAPHAHHAGAQHGANSSPLSPHATRHRAQHGATAAAASACASPDGAVAGGAHVLERPTILFVPGGAFVADFEAADLFFL